MLNRIQLEIDYCILIQILLLETKKFKGMTKNVKLIWCPNFQNRLEAKAFPTWLSILNKLFKHKEKEEKLRLKSFTFHKHW